MLPSLVSQELKHSVNRFLQTTFPSASAGFQRTDAKGLEEQTIDELLQTAEQLFKGPYLSLGLPFRTANSDVKLPFEVLNPGYLPYSHQLAAYKRLCGESPQSTLIATGTGSGKTECFMYPLLDHCAQHQGPGIKAIIVYPMNALATDQARRFAKEIHSTDALRGKVRVGLFVGDSEQSPDRSMSETSVITSKDTLRDDPPDILLTNYKMLDYLLIRPKDRPLWRFNTPGMLRYLVVDELHTFDGAQGTDLACLIRRIRDRLQIGAEMACVGTSATIGGESSVQALLAYARKVFATELDDKAVIREDRLSAEEFLAEHPVLYTSWPEDSTLLQMSPDNYHSIADYVSAHARLWFDEPPQGLKSSNPTTRQNACVALAQLLRQHAAVHKLLQDVQGISNTEVLAANYVECGTVTPRPQIGNPKPRLFRLTEDQAVINRMGFNNGGLEAFKKRFEARDATKGIVGANLGANKDSDDRVADYTKGLAAMWGLADYFTINISSPNTPGLRDLQGANALDDLLGRIKEERAGLAGGKPSVPIFLKVAPDLDSGEIERMTEQARTYGMNAIIVSNTTIDRPDTLQSGHKGEGGGLSGAPLMAKSTETLKEFAAAADGKIDLIGVGGIASGADAYAKIRAGAKAVQLYSAMVFQGPGLVMDIRKDLSARLKADGFASIQEAVRTA